MTQHVMCLISQPEMGDLSPRVSEAYSTVGGLSKQIQEIRDLLEIPLTRPELFRYFGAQLRPTFILSLSSSLVSLLRLLIPAPSQV